MIAAHGINPASQPVLSRIPALTLVDAYRQGERYDYAAALQTGGAARCWGRSSPSRCAATWSCSQDRGLDRISADAPRRRCAIATPA